MTVQYEEKEVSLSSVDLNNTEFDFRKRVNPDAIVRYSDVPPNEVAEPILLLEQDQEPGEEVNFTILSGRQRLTAWKSRNLESVKARVFKNLSRAEAILLSATPNTVHGVPTTTGERKAAFQAYLRALPPGTIVDVPHLAPKFGISVSAGYTYHKQVQGVVKPKPAKVDKPLDELLNTIKYSPEKITKVKPEDWQELTRRERNKKIADLKTVMEDLQQVLDLANEVPEDETEIVLGAKEVALND